MALLLILLILTLGYTYSDSINYERIKLRRSSGWESYVYLAKHGLTFVILAILKILVFVAFLYTVFFISKYVLTKCDNTKYLAKLDALANSATNLAAKINLTDINLFTFFILTLTFILISFLAVRECYESIWSKKANADEHLDELRKQDATLSVIIEAMTNNKTVKVSLKSRKVYVGLVQTELFESIDLDNIVIIPFLSGYRDDDKLRIIFDCDYLSVYKKNKILQSGGITKEVMKKLDAFRLVIQMEEVESISLFSAKYYEQFEFKKEGFLVRLKNII